MRLVSLEHLPEGARLAEPVWSAAHGRINPLLAKGVLLTDGVRAALRRHGVGSVWIVDDLSEGVAEERALPAEVRDRAAAQLATMFAVAAREGGEARVPAADLARVEQTVHEILAAVRSSSALVHALVDSCVADARILSHGINACIAGLVVGEQVLGELGWTDWKGTHRTKSDPDRLVQLGLGLVLHDIGLAGLPAELLDADGLTAAETELVEDHPRLGLEMLVRCDLSPLARVVVGDHHEMLDGSGYPSRKAGGRIHQHARIAAVVDTFHGAASGLEPGLAATSPADAWALVVKRAGQGALDAAITRIFTRVIAPFPQGVAVRLSDGRSGIVSSVPLDDVCRPTVRVIDEPDVGGVTPYEVEVARTPGLQVVCQIPAPGEREGASAAAALSTIL